MHIFNTLTNKKEEFIPLKKGHIGMYVCGPTVYDVPHIGHARSAYVFSVIRRYFIYRGFNVKFVRNVTDVDDKIIEKARREYREQSAPARFIGGPGSTENRNLKDIVKEISKKYLKAYHENMALLEIEKPDKEPKATEYIPKMIKFIEGLIKNSCAYVADGDVYFDIRKAKGYGKLSNQSLDKMKAGARIMPDENKKDVLDFALWKKAKPDEPSWPSPWGEGRPGWHIECSVMSSDILGDEFDIHGGGRDLIFPHHENEIVQSEGLGKAFAKYWIHHGLLTINGQKMAKSLGNFITVKDFLSRHKNANYLRLFFLSSHYSHPVDYTEQKLEESKKAYERFVILLERIERQQGSRRRGTRDEGRETIGEFKTRFIEAMDDDFNTPQAMSFLFDFVNECHKVLDEKKTVPKDAIKIFKELVSLFGLSFDIESGGLNEESIKEAIKKRQEFRNEKRFKEADRIRKDLYKNGIILEDTKDDVIWRRRIF